jgi:hypothetical protein
MNEAPPPDDWDIRGELAAALTCWHRLSGTEAAQLVQYATELHLQLSKKSDAMQRLWVERDALQSERAGMLDRSSGIIASLRAEIERLNLLLNATAMNYDKALTESQAEVERLTHELDLAVRLGKVLEKQRDMHRAEFKALREQDPVMIYHGGCTIDCGQNGHHNMEMLKLIPAGSPLYLASGAAQKVEPSVEKEATARYGHTERSEAFVEGWKAAQAAPQPLTDIGDKATIAGLETSVLHLSAMFDEQLRMLIEIEEKLGLDGMGAPLNDGESELIDRLRAYIQSMTSPAIREAGAEDMKVYKAISDNWSDIGKMMGEWLAANQQAAPKEPPPDDENLVIEMRMKGARVRRHYTEAHLLNSFYPGQLVAFESQRIWQELAEILKKIDGRT